METATKLVIQHEDDPDFELEHAIEGNVVVLGRSASCDIVLYDLNNVISRRHAQIYEKDGLLLVKDLMSRNRTVLNERILIPHTPYTLTDGDILRISRYRFVVSIPESKKENEPWLFQSGDTIPLNETMVRDEPALIVSSDPEDTLRQWQGNAVPESDRSTEDLSPDVVSEMHEPELTDGGDEDAARQRAEIGEPAYHDDVPFIPSTDSLPIDRVDDERSSTGDWFFGDVETPSILDKMRPVFEEESPENVSPDDTRESAMTYPESVKESIENSFTPEFPQDMTDLSNFDERGPGLEEASVHILEDVDHTLENGPEFDGMADSNSDLVEETLDFGDQAEFKSRIRQTSTVVSEEVEHTIEGCKFSGETRRLGEVLDKLERLYREEAYAEREFDLMEAFHSAVSDKKGTRVAMALQAALRVS